MPANWQVLRVTAATGHGRDQAEIKQALFGAADGRLSGDAAAGSLGLGSDFPLVAGATGVKPRPTPATIARKYSCVHRDFGSNVERLVARGRREDDPCP
jgi:hypothetical protein